MLMDIYGAEILEYTVYTDNEYILVFGPSDTKAVNSSMYANQSLCAFLQVETTVLAGLESLNLVFSGSV